MGNSPVTVWFPAQRASNAEKCFHLMTSSCVCDLFSHIFAMVVASFIVGQSNGRNVTLAHYSLSEQTSYRQVSGSLEAARLDVMIIVSLRNSTGISTGLLPMCLSNIRAIEKNILKNVNRYILWTLQKSVKWAEGITQHEMVDMSHIDWDTLSKYLHHRYPCESKTPYRQISRNLEVATNRFTVRELGNGLYDFWRVW